MLNAALDMVQDPPAAMTALSELDERENQQRLNPDKKLWERWDSLQGAVHDRILESVADRRYPRSR